MRLVIQRVSEASVDCENTTLARIEQGIAILVGVAHGDETADAERLAGKVANLRIFEDETGRLQRSVLDIGGQALVVPNFTLYGDCRKGRRPSFTHAAPPHVGAELFAQFVAALSSHAVPVQTGRFGAHMRVRLVNDGPVTILMDSTDFS